MLDMRQIALAVVLLASRCVTPCAAQTPAAVSLEVKASGPKTFYVDDQAGSNQVSFSSQSTLEDFTGVCNKVRGECGLDPKALSTLRGKFSIRVEDMKTGIDLRDTHMRSADWLDAAQNPEITIEVTAVDDLKKASANSATMTLIGTCAVRGKSNAVRLPATLTYLDESAETQKRVKGDLIRIRSEFKLKLSDYGVVGPKGAETIGLKVSDEIQLKVTVFGSTTPPPKPLEADKPLGGASQPAKPAPPKRPGGR